MKALTWKEVFKLPVNTLFRVKPKEKTDNWAQTFANAVKANKVFKKTKTNKTTKQICCVTTSHPHKADWPLKEYDLKHLDIYLVNSPKPQPKKLTRLETLIL